MVTQQKSQDPSCAVLECLSSVCLSVVSAGAGAPTRPLLHSKSVVLKDARLPTALAVEADQLEPHSPLHRPVRRASSRMSSHLCVTQSTDEAMTAPLYSCVHMRGKPLHRFNGSSAVYLAANSSWMRSVWSFTFDVSAKLLAVARLITTLWMRRLQHCRCDARCHQLLSGGGPFCPRAQGSPVVQGLSRCPDLPSGRMNCFRSLCRYRLLSHGFVSQRLIARRHPQPLPAQDRRRVCLKSAQRIIKKVRILVHVLAPPRTVSLRWHSVTSSARARGAAPWAEPGSAAGFEQFNTIGCRDLHEQSHWLVERWAPPR